MKGNTLFKAISLVEVNLNGANAHDTRAHCGPTHVSISLPESLNGFPKHVICKCWITHIVNPMQTLNEMI